MTGPRLLVAGIGNIFLADDAFGPEVVGALQTRPLPPEVHVQDFGIRGMDLAFQLLEGYEAAVFVDAAPRGHPPGTLSLVEPDIPDPATQAVSEAHGMDPVKVLALAARLGDGVLPRIVVLACEPQVRLYGDEDVIVGLSTPVRAAVEGAVRLLHTVVPLLLADPGAPLAFGRAEDSPTRPTAGLQGIPARAPQDR